MLVTDVTSGMSKTVFVGDIVTVTTSSLYLKVLLKLYCLLHFLVSPKIYHEMATRSAIFDAGSTRSPYFIFLLAFYLSSSA